MFYSPTKEFVRFNTYRTEEIKVLKDRIQKEKVTAEEIASTQARLLNLKNQYDLLHQQDHSELKSVMLNSEAAINELLQEKTAMIKEADIKKQDITEMQQMQVELQEKGSQIEELLRQELKQKERLLEVKKQNDEHILLLDREYGSLSKDRDNQRGIKEQVGKTESEINKKWDDYWKEMEDCRILKEDLTHQVYNSKEHCQNLKAQWQLGQQQIGKLQVLIDKAKLQQDLCNSNITVLTAQKQKHKEYQWMLVQEKQKGCIVESLLRTITQETVRVEREQIGCQKQIKDTLTKVTQQQQMKIKLEQKVAAARLSLKQLKEKNDNLKTKMNSIFKNDSELIKTISSKRVYPNCKAEVIDIIKKSLSQPFDCKENMSPGIPSGKLQQASPFDQRLSEMNRIV